HRDIRALHSFPTRRSSDLAVVVGRSAVRPPASAPVRPRHVAIRLGWLPLAQSLEPAGSGSPLQTAVACRGCYGVSVSRDSPWASDRKSTRLNSSHLVISYA